MPLGQYSAISKDGCYKIHLKRLLVLFETFLVPLNPTQQ